jgi:hypothetical protein
MSKTKNANAIKYIYLTMFNGEDLTFNTQRLEVSREYSRYVSLADGSRVDTDDIVDLCGSEARKCYRSGSKGYSEASKLTYELLENNRVYTLKPINRATKNQIRDERILDVASAIDRDESAVTRAYEEVKRFEQRLAKDKDLFAKLKAIHYK